MILKELSLQNYRVFREADFSFSDQVTVLAGVNGRGKSSALDVIALMLSRLFPQISSVYTSSQDSSKCSKSPCRSRAVGCAVRISLFEGFDAHGAPYNPRSKRPRIF